jgi:hypothetical protein
MSFYIKSNVTIRLKLRNCGISGYRSNELSGVNTLHERNLQYVDHQQLSSLLFLPAYRVCSANTRKYLI